MPFTGTPIFGDNATQYRISGETKTLLTTRDIFPQELHRYTITHAIDERTSSNYTLITTGQRARIPTKRVKMLGS
jgi:type I restriction enzyme R subunit